MLVSNAIPYWHSGCNILPSPSNSNIFATSDIERESPSCAARRRVVVAIRKSETRLIQPGNHLRTVLQILTDKESKPLLTPVRC
jgi:hypothetical protein